MLQKIESLLLFATKSEHVARSLCISAKAKIVYCVTLQRNFVQSVVIIHATCDNLICCMTILPTVGGKMRNIAFKTFCTSKMFQNRLPVFVARVTVPLTTVIFISIVQMIKL